MDSSLHPVPSNNFLTVGRSRAAEASYAETDYAPIARFGIGFWSVFTIAQKAQIETAAFEPYRGSPSEAGSAAGVSFEVSLEELKDYTVFRSVTRPCGTKVVLTLRDEVVFDDVFAQGRGMLLCCEVPLTLVLDDKALVVPQALPEVSDTDILGSRSRVLDEFGVQIFRWRGTMGDTELSVGFAYREVDGRATFLADQSSSLLNVIPGIRNPRTSVCGFSVPVRPDPLCIDLARVGTFFANHRTPKGFEFALDRQQLLPNAGSAGFATNITDLFHAGYREFLAKTNSQDPSTMADLRDQAQMHGGNVFDQFTGSELSNAAERHPDLLCFRLYPVHQNVDLAHVEPICVDLSRLQTMTGMVFTLQTSASVKLQGAAFISFYAEKPQALMVVYEAVRSWISSGVVTQAAYVMEANRLGSMLFDCDPDSSVRFVDHAPFSPLCIQAISLEGVNFKTSPSGILAQVQGAWSGAIYVRSFETPNGRPYLFLGRFRVLVESSSRLCQHLRELVVSGRRMQLAETIAHLKEDEAGYTPEAVRHLL